MAQITKLFDTNISFIPTDPNALAPKLPSSPNGYQGQESQIPVFPYEGKDFIPTPYGYKSFFGINKTLDISALVSRAQEIFIIQSPELKNFLVALCEDGIWYKYGSTTGTWNQALTLSFSPSIQKEWSFCVLNKKTYCYRQGDPHFYELSISSTTLTAVEKTPTFLTMEAQQGIFRAGGRLGFWDSVGSISWSTIDSVEDHTPSVSTLAGNAIFQDVIGNIVLIKSYADGFIIYATKSITLVQRDLDSPLLWRPSSVLVNNGISYRRQVAVDNTAKTHFVFTSSGMFMISDSITQIGTELTDLLMQADKPFYLKLLNGRYLFLEILSEGTTLGQVSFTESSVLAQSYNLHQAGTPVPVNANFVPGNKALIGAIAEAFDLLLESQRFPTTTTNHPLSRWRVWKGELTYVAALPDIPWYDINSSDLEVLITSPFVAGSMYATRGPGVNDPVVGDVLEDQIQNIWPAFEAAQAQKIARIPMYEDEEVMNDYAIVTVPPGGTPPVMGEGLYATTEEEEDLGLIITGAGASMFDRGFVPAEVHQQQWVRAKKFFQQVKRIKKHTVTSYSIGSTQITNVSTNMGWNSCEEPDLVFPVIGDSIDDFVVKANAFSAASDYLHFGNGGDPVPSGTCPLNQIDNYGKFVNYRRVGDNVYAQWEGASYCYYPVTDCHEGKSPVSIKLYTKLELMPLLYDVIYHITRTKNYFYTVESDPLYPDGGNYGESTFEALEEYRDNITINFDDFTVDSTLNLPTGSTIPPVSYTDPVWPFPSDLSFQPTTFFLQDGSPAPLFPVIEGAYVYDISLKKWGSLNSSYSLLLDYSPVNSNSGEIIPVETFNTAMGALKTDGTICLFDEYSSQSYMKWGKIGLYRLGMTQPQETIIQFRNEPNGTVSLVTSVDGKSEDSTLTHQTDSTEVQTILYGGFSGRWHSVVISGYYDITSIEFRGTTSGRR